MTKAPTYTQLKHKRNTKVNLNMTKTGQIMHTMLTKGGFKVGKLSTVKFQILGRITIVKEGRKMGDKCAICRGYLWVAY